MSWEMKPVLWASGKDGDKSTSMPQLILKWAPSPQGWVHQGHFPDGTNNEKHALCHRAKM